MQLSQVRVAALEAGSRRFESCFPDHLFATVAQRQSSRLLIGRSRFQNSPVVPLFMYPQLNCIEQRFSKPQVESWNLSGYTKDCNTTVVQLSHKEFVGSSNLSSPNNLYGVHSSMVERQVVALHIPDHYRMDTPFINILNLF